MASSFFCLNSSVTLWCCAALPYLSNNHKWCTPPRMCASSFRWTSGGQWQHSSPGLSCTSQVQATILAQSPYSTRTAHRLLSSPAQQWAAHHHLPWSRDGMPLKLSTSHIWEHPYQLLSKESGNNHIKTLKSWLTEKIGCVYMNLLM